MTWNYRVIEFTKDDVTWQAIHEVYYDRQTGEPVSYTVEAVGVVAVLEELGVRDPDESLAKTYGRMAEAFGKPVLKPADFPTSPTTTQKGV